MKKIIVLVFTVFIVIGLTGCRVMKRPTKIPAPKTKHERKILEKEANELYKKGDYLSAIKRLKALLKKYPKNSKYWNQLGSAYAQLNKFDYAIYALEKAIKYNPKNVKAMYNLSIVYSEKGNKEKALKVVKKALKLDPKNPLLQASLGNILIDKEKYDTAKKVYERIVKVKPNFDIGHFNLGVINYKKRNLDEAEKNYKQVLKIKPDDVDAKENLAAIYIIKNNYEDAISYLKDVINSNPEDDITLENAYYNLGVAYLRRGQYKKALEAFETALKIEPWDMAAYVNAAIICERLGYKKKAIKYWKKYDRLLPIHKRKEEMKKHLKNLGVDVDENKN